MSLSTHVVEYSPVEASLSQTSKLLPLRSVNRKSSLWFILTSIYSNFLITDCGMGNDVNCFLVILCPVRRLINSHMRWKFVVGPRKIAPFDCSDMVLVRVASSRVSAYVTNYNLQYLCSREWNLSWFTQGIMFERFCCQEGRYSAIIPQTGSSQSRFVLGIYLMAGCSI